MASRPRPEVTWSSGSSSLPCGPSIVGCSPASTVRRTMSVSPVSSKRLTNSNPASKICKNSKLASTNSRLVSHPQLPQHHHNNQLRPPLLPPSQNQLNHPL